MENLQILYGQWPGMLFWYARVDLFDVGFDVDVGNDMGGDVVII
jgi:hypothetical protein